MNRALFSLFLITLQVLSSYAFKVEDLNQLLAKLTAQNAAEKKLAGPALVPITFVQPLDHSDFSNTATFDQTLIYNTQFFDPQQPKVLVYSCAEASWHYYVRQEELYNIMEYSRAAILFVEHRFYGDSFGNFKRSDLKYLSVTQALADLARAVAYFKNDILKAPTATAVTVGGSYAGMLAVWARMRYPSLFLGAFGSSAPFQSFATKDQLPYNYFQLVTKDYTEVSKNCSDIIRQGFTELQQKFELQQFTQVQNQLQLCKTPVMSDLRQIQGWLRTAFLSMAQGNYPYPTGDHPTSEKMARKSGLGSGLPAYPVTASCEAVLDKSSRGSALDALFAGANVYFSGSYDTKCRDFDGEFWDCGDQSGCGDYPPDPDSLAWDYQVCTELSTRSPYTESDGVHDMFYPRSWTPEDLQAYCRKQYNVAPNFDYIPVNFGTGDFTGSSNILFTNGFEDPWFGGGVLKSQRDDLIAMIVPRSAHHLDLNKPYKNDPQEIVKARVLIKKIVKAMFEQESETKKNTLALLRKEADTYFHE